MTDSSENVFTEENINVDDTIEHFETPESNTKNSHVHNHEEDTAGYVVGNSDKTGESTKEPIPTNPVVHFHDHEKDTSSYIANPPQESKEDNNEDNNHIVDIWRPRGHFVGLNQVSQVSQETNDENVPSRSIPFHKNCNITKWKKWGIFCCSMSDVDKSKVVNSGYFLVGVGVLAGGYVIYRYWKR